MNKKQTILLLTNIGIILMFLSNVSLGQAAKREWNAGEVIFWGISEEVKQTSHDLKEDVKYIETSQSATDYKLNITAIDILTKRYNAYRTDYSGTNLISNVNFGAQHYIDNNLILSNFIGVNYVWDYEHNRTVCYEFDISLGSRYLIEPDWKLINEAFKEMLNGSIIIETVSDPYSSTVYNFTLLDVFTEFNAKINGKSPLAVGLDTFTDTRRKWTFEFDLSNIIHTRYWNDTIFIYEPVEKFLIKVELEYSDGGILKNVLQSFNVKYTAEDYSTEIDAKYKIALGGVKSVAANFATLTTLAGLITLGTIVAVIKRRRK